MKLFVEPMDATVVEVSPDGRVRLENEDWSEPTLQERRAFIYAAENEVVELRELIAILQDGRMAALLRAVMLDAEKIDRSSAASVHKRGKSSEVDIPRRE